MSIVELEDTGRAALTARATGSTTRRNLAFVYISYASRYLYLLILLPFYGRVLGAEAYGRVLAAMALYMLVWMASDYGFASAGIRDAATVRDDARALAVLYGKQMAGRLVMLVLAAAIGVGGTLLSPTLATQPELGIIATVSGILAGLNVNWLFQGTGRFRTSVSLEVLSLLISLPLILSFVRGPQDSWVILGSLLVSYVICDALGHALALRMVDVRAVRITGGIKLVRETTALFAARASGEVLSHLSTYLISILATATQVGWYGAAERLAGVALNVTLPAYQVLVGTICQRLAKPETEKSAHDLMGTAAVAMVGVGVLMCIVSWSLSGIFIPLVLGPEFGPSVGLLHVLSLMFPCAAITQVISSCVLVPLRRDLAVTKMSLIATLVTTGLMVMLGQAGGADGIAWARALGALLMAALSVETLRRHGLLTMLWAHNPVRPWLAARKP